MQTSPASRSLPRRAQLLGLAIACVIGAASIGPSIASWSGNGETQPVRSFRGAWASFPLANGGSRTFGIWTGASTDLTTSTAGPGAGAGLSGGVYATTKTCTVDRSKTPHVTTCTTSTMRGELPAVATSDWDGRFEQAPDQSTARFTGYLDGGSRMCRFTVNFQATGTLQVRPETGGSLSYVAGTRRYSAVRGASSTLTSDCWPALAGGSGEIWRNLLA